MRKKRIYKKYYKPDMKFKNIAVTRFVNYIMEGGKKAIAEKILYDALDLIKSQTKEDPVMVFEKAVENVSPLMEVSSRRVGGANYQVPRPVRAERKFMLAGRWIIEAARSGKGKPMAQKIAQEIISAYKNEGVAIKKKQDVHRMAEANRAFAHFAL